MSKILEFLTARVGPEKAIIAENKLQLYREHILKWNQKVNLTAIKEEKDFDQKHSLDSLLAYDWIKRLPSNKIVDIGTGGGFPGIPLAIVFPEKEFVLVDSLKKRLRIIDEGAEFLGLDNVTTVHGRAEDVGRNPQYRDSFDIAISRAVANMSVLSELCLPLVKPTGHFIAYKGPEAYKELELSTSAISILKGNVNQVYKPEWQESVEGGSLEHVLVLIEKIGKTPKNYPRKAGVPSKEPL